MKKCVLALLMTGSLAKADLVRDFRAMNAQSKGPFSKNILQHDRGRSVVAVGGAAGGGISDGCVRGSGLAGRFQFQAAFPNESAQALAAQDFYVGNLFTTNYYMLTGEYVFNDRCGSHKDDQEALLSQKARAMPKAVSMVRHWNLERHYVEYNRESRLSRSFQLRGISDAANESQYAQYFFNFYLSAMNAETQFLPAFLLVRESPVGASSQIDVARNKIAEEYDRFCSSSGCNSPSVVRLYKLRNAIHNQLSQDVIGDIDKYLQDFPEYARRGNTRLQEVQRILRAYYSFTPQKIAEQAEKADLQEVKALADQVNRRGVTVEGLLALSRAGADLRTNLAHIPTAKKVYALVTIAVISQYVNKEINKMPAIPSKEVIQALLNTVYMEGFLIHDNWVYFSEELSSAAGLKAAGSLLVDVAEIAQETLNQAFQPALQQWVSIEPKMQSFVDNTIKSSSLNTVSITAQKLQ